MVQMWGGNGFDVRDKPKSASGERTNDGLRRSGVADRAPGGVDARIQGLIGNDPPTPDALDQFLSPDDAASLLDQIDKQAEDLRFDRHRTLRAPEFEKLGIQREAAEAVDHGLVEPPTRK